MDFLLDRVGLIDLGAVAQAYGDEIDVSTLK